MHKMSYVIIINIFNNLDYKINGLKIRLAIALAGSSPPARTMTADQRFDDLEKIAARERSAAARCEPCKVVPQGLGMAVMGGTRASPHRSRFPNFKCSWAGEGTFAVRRYLPHQVPALPCVQTACHVFSFISA